MEIQETDYEKLGKFYLGRDYDLKAGELEDELVLYDSKDLVTHGVVLGMTGSGKTGLCLSLLEEAAMDNIPAIIIDPKGDIANLMLTFPEFQGSDFEPWINEDDARKKGISPTEYASKTAEMWKDGIAEWGQSPDRVRTFQEKVDINIFTPGSKAGIPVSILGSLSAPPFEVMDDGELLGDQIESTVSSLLSLVGVDADPIQSPEAILMSSILQHCWAAEQDLTLESLIRQVQKPPFDKIGVLDLESFINKKERQKLALKFNGLLASPGFSTWLEGPSMDIQNMMYTPAGKPRMSIFSIAHLSDEERMFFVSLLLNQMLGWMRSQSGTTSLRAMLYMDEIYGYLPPTANPPSKKPLMTILKQGRAFGLGTLLATQNPVDLDYKALSNTGTWWLGRLQTERDKARVLDGLEGAAVQGGFNRKEMEELLAGLGSRVFLMNNVHDDAPTIFHVRWVMSYLRGPMTRTQIKKLMDPKRDAFDPKGSQKESSAPVNSNPFAQSAPSAVAPAERPIVGDGIKEFFAPVIGEADGITYRPHLLRQAEVHFTSIKAKTEGSRSVRLVNSLEEKGPNWKEEQEFAIPLGHCNTEPAPGIGFADLPGYAMNADNYKPLKDEFGDWIYRNERAEILYASLLKEYSKFGEPERDFRARLAHSAREERDEAVDKLRDKFESKIRTKQGQIERAEIAVDREKEQANSAKMQAGAAVLGGLLGGLFGGRRSSRSTFSKASRAVQQHGDIKRAKQKVDILERDMHELESELQDKIQELEEKLNASNTALEPEILKPYKKDIDIQEIAILWLPYSDREEPLWK